ncbi:MAG: hypothetical protein RBT34_09585 [Anaerolineaceae bacterium]|jgi:hypothetical protein|nr:hypothetical protein [Anaerolineaceae bacterium]
MRITRASLMKLAKAKVAEMVYNDRSLVCIYLTGSMLREAPLLGGTIDIDLMCIHRSEPPIAREIVRFTDEVHLDIAHYDQQLFQQPRALRHDPWLGSYLCEDPIVLHVQQHWFEFVQAGVSDQFFLPENILKRCRPQAEAARQIWLAFYSDQVGEGPQQLQQYLRALEGAANAIACLNGSPLTERRFLLEYPARAAAIQRPGLAAGLEDLIMQDSLSLDTWQSWLADWADAFDSASQSENVPARLHPTRKAYYLRAMEAMWTENPAAALWPFLQTWSRMRGLLHPSAPALQAWDKIAETLALTPAHMEDRLNALDAYLDMVEETLDAWQENQGL